MIRDSVIINFLILLGFILCVVQNAQSQFPDLKFEHFFDEKGFAQNTVVDIIQDKDGYIWIGTPNGLYKYDGQKFVVYKNEPTNSETLIANSITALEMDDEGNIFIGTSFGICMYDRGSESFIKLNDDLDDKRINCMYPDEFGGLWVGTEKSGLYHLSNIKDTNKKWVNYINQPTQKRSINSNEILALEMDNAGNLWVGTEGGLNKLISLETNGGFIEFANEFGLVSALFKDKKGSLWIGSDENRIVCLQNPESVTNSDQIQSISYLLGKSIVSSSDLKAHEFVESEQGNLWISIENYGLCSLNPENGSYRIHSHDSKNRDSMYNNRVMSVLLDKSGVLWVGNIAGGIHKCDLNRKEILQLKSFHYEENSLSNPSINTILQDKQNSLWVGTDNGLNHITFKEYNFKSPLFTHYYHNDSWSVPQKKGEDRVLSIFKDSQDDYWIGHKSSITYMSYNSEEQQARFSPTDFKINMVYSILEDSNGFIWFGSLGNGLLKWKKEKTKKVDNYDFSNGILYQATNGDRFSISSNLITALYEDKKGNLWVGTRNGGLNLKVPGKEDHRDTFITYRHIPQDSTSLSHNTVYSMLEAENGTFWVGTYEGGLNKMILPESENDPITFIHYTEKDGLVDNSVYGILEDQNGFLWLSTDNGISRFDPIEKTFKNYGVGDGLQSNNFRKSAYYQNDDGVMFFGGLKGVNIFNPENLKDNPIKPEVVITDLKIMNRTVEVGENFNGRVLYDQTLSKVNEIELKNDESSLTISFSAMHFAAPDKNMFKYQLEGFDTQWQDSGSLNFAHYTNLSPGNYTFKVKASNNDGLWSNTPAILRVKILSPLWRTTWAYLFYLLLFAALGIGVRSFYKIRRENRESMIRQNEIEEANKLKLQFFTNISHDFKTPITLILNPVEELLTTVKETFSLRPKLELIHRNANYLLRLVNQLMEFRKIELGETRLQALEGNIVDFTKEITFSFKSMASKKNIKLSFESQLYELDVWFDWDKLEKILNNLISNAIKYTPEGGEVTVGATKVELDTYDGIGGNGIKKEFLRIKVEDNGKGIPKDQLPYIFQRFYQVKKTTSNQNLDLGTGIGLAIAKDLVDLHHGNLEVDSMVGKGSCFMLTLPLGNHHLSEEEISKANNNEFEITNTKELSIIDENVVDDLGQSHTKRNSLLIIDDNADIRTVVMEGFQDNYEIFEAENGKEGLHVAQREIPDLIISDVLMPVMDGVEFTRLVKSNIRTCHIPIILLTALSSIEHRIKGLESGADAYLPKPFKMKLLKVRVSKLIESRDLIYKQFQVDKKLMPEKVVLNSIDQEFLNKIMHLMETNMANDYYWVDELATDMNASRSTFFRKLKKLTGQPPNDFMRMVRLKRAAQLLEQNQLSIAEVSYSVGFSDPNYFGKSFRKVYGKTPTQYTAQE